MNSLTSATDDLPRNEEAERALLGSMILAQSAVEAALERLVSSDFFLPRHQVIFEAMKKLAA
ncbi:MAG: DnaB-like helicase N-terminal domain-containing protein, partial [Eubacteriales bacterium]|nr:DnaB-like helicase N-terminal domain-containing protein [Eubacteriales bacterium]